MIEGRTDRTWRFLVDEAADAAWNMAVDEAILDRYAEGSDLSPTLRFYRWRPGALSLGRHQEARGAHDPAYLRAQGLDLVRRPTGGSAVLHEYERTYAVVGRLDREPFDAGVRRTSEAIGLALSRALAGLGIGARTVPPGAPGPGTVEADPACFARPSDHELVGVDGGKLVGSAQLRRRRAFLQHGSIPLRSDPRRLARVLGRPARAGSPVDLEGPRGPIGLPELDRAIMRAFESSFAIRLIPGHLEDAESIRATRLAAWKYASTAWTLGGRYGDREARWGPLERLQT